MSAEDRLRWDKVFQAQLDANAPYPAADPLLLRYAPPVDADTAQPDDPTGHIPRALDLAGGLGQNALWLAQQGYTVDLLDISRVALERARQEMAVRNLRNVNLLQMDVDRLQLEAAQYDLICVFRYLKRHLFALLKMALKPGGLMIYESITLEYLRHVPEFNRDFLLQQGELAGFFAGWQLVHQQEPDHRAQVVVQKPRTL
jgi:tellurite methyltransferase